MLSPNGYPASIYNSVLTRRHRHIREVKIATCTATCTCDVIVREGGIPYCRCERVNSSASTPPNATKIAEMKVSHHGLEIVGPELLFSIYKCCFLEFVCAR